MAASNLTAIAKIAEAEGRAALVRMRGAAGTAQAAALLQSFAQRMAKLAAQLADGTLTPTEGQRALESEREALAYNLGALAKQQQREYLSGLLDTALSFMQRIIGG